MHEEQRNGMKMARFFFAFLAGMFAGLASAKCLQMKDKWMESDRGRMMMAKMMRMKLMRKAGGIKNLTREKYEALIDEMIHKLRKWKRLPEARLQRLRKFLAGSWEEVRLRYEHMQRENEEDENAYDDEEEEGDEEDEEDEDDDAEEEESGRKKR